MPSRMRFVGSAFRYLMGKALTILITIFIGVFITMLVVNYPANVPGEPGTSPFANNLEGQIALVVQINAYQGVIPWGANGPDQGVVDAMTKELRSRAGLDLPVLPR